MTAPKPLCLQYDARGDGCVNWVVRDWTLMTADQIKEVALACMSACETMGKSCEVRMVPSAVVQYYCLLKSDPEKKGVLDG